MSSRVFSGGRVTIPKWARDHLGLEPGDKVTFRYVGDGKAAIEKVTDTGSATEEPESSSPNASS